MNNNNHTLEHATGTLLFCQQSGIVLGTVGSERTLSLLYYVDLTLALLFYH